MFEMFIVSANACYMFGVQASISSLPADSIEVEE